MDKDVNQSYVITLVLFQQKPTIALYRQVELLKRCPNHEDFPSQCFPNLYNCLMPPYPTASFHVEWETQTNFSIQGIRLYSYLHALYSTGESNRLTMLPPLFANT